MLLYDREYSRREIEERSGTSGQIFGVERYKLSEGLESGTEMIRIRTGAGLSYNISISKGFDISLTEYMGIPISWQSNNGNVNPAYYNAFQNEWTRAVAGGLLFTCGLRQVGTECMDDGVFYAKHGRVHNIPAKNVSLNCKWDQNDYIMTASGQMNETAMFGENIGLTRQYFSKVGENSINITDTLQNNGFNKEQVMLLYHFNFGFPMMDEKTTINIPSTAIMSENVSVSTDDCNKWQKPEIGAQSKVYYHTLDKDSTADVEICNPEFPLLNGKLPTSVKLNISWNTKNLPNLVQWKMPAAGQYVLGIEPANCYVDGRINERMKGTAIYLEPGEKIEYQLKISVK